MKNRNPTSRIRIEYAPLDKIREWPGNPRVIGDDQYRPLVKSLDEFGVEPFIVEERYRVVGGHQRLKALRSIGVEEMPTVKLSRWETYTHRIARRRDRWANHGSNIRLI